MVFLFDVFDGKMNRGTATSANHQSPLLPARRHSQIDSQDERGRPHLRPGRLRIASASPSIRPTNIVHAERPTASTFFEYLLVITALAVIVLAIDTFVLDRVWFQSVSPHLDSLSRDAFYAGLAACELRNFSSSPNSSLFERKRNARFVDAISRNLSLIAPSLDQFISDNKPITAVKSSPLLIKHATVWNGAGLRLYDVDIAIVNGLIGKIAKNLNTSDSVFVDHMSHTIQVWDVETRVVSPGLVDMHSHSGMTSTLGFSGEQDVNEKYGGPLVPQMRAIDAFDPLDKSIDLIVAGGVTTSLILPGSSTLMGGEGFAIKMARTTSNSVHDLLLNRGLDSGLDQLDSEWRWMKMACGENPKSGSWGLETMPDSRMGSGWLFRETLEKAKKILWQQDDWCVSAQSIQLLYGNEAHLRLNLRFPDALQYESLVALLRKKVKLQVHCYQVNDIDMMLRNSQEFDFKITAFHHATEAHLIAEKLSAKNISAAIFADHSLYKREAYKHSVKAGQILNKAGVKVVYKSDHPVTNSQNLIYEAQKAVHYGLDEDVAFAAVTSVPAEKIGAGNRIGKIAQGFDADLVIWDRSPFQLGARPLRVLVDGFPIISLPWTLSPAVPNPKIYANERETQSGKITVESGIITCIGKKCEEKGTIFDLNQGVVIPGLISAMVPVGLQEIGQEPSSRDGIAGTKDSLSGFVYAKDGIKVGGLSKMQKYAFRSGVLTSVVAPAGNGLVRGVGVAIQTRAEGLNCLCIFFCSFNEVLLVVSEYNDAILVSDVGMFVTIGHEAKGFSIILSIIRILISIILQEPYAKSIATQFARLRKFLEDTKNLEPQSPIHAVLAGNLSLVVTVHDPNDISKLLLITAPYRPALRLVIAGASGAWHVADEISKAEVPVILLPARCQRYSWEMRWCKQVGGIGPSTYEILKAAGVTVGISVKEANQVRNLLFEAGWATVGDAKERKINDFDAIGSITWRIAEIFGIGDRVGTIRVGKNAKFLGFDGGPVGFGYNIQFIADGKFVTLSPSYD
ncbi:hypothetical protein HK100_009166 [Physocladia obscura]|uniref:Amidohydrolase-related domain-containing protein n=1 Tax=Physocladia obscura TaxID=109957 RepID=A0AAD5T6A9_9FUNG|nr:hypothetical protein HK100_009166 [Physocladia obscura]